MNKLLLVSISVAFIVLIPVALTIYYESNINWAYNPSKQPDYNDGSNSSTNSTESHNFLGFNF